MSDIREYFDSLRGKRIAVIGMGVSNTPLIRMLLRADLDVTVCDRAQRERKSEDQQLATEGRRVFTGHGLANLVQAQSLSRSTLLRSGVHQTVVQLDVQVSHHSPSF